MRGEWTLFFYPEESIGQDLSLHGHLYIMYSILSTRANPGPSLSESFATSRLSFSSQHYKSSCTLRMSDLAIECFTMLAIRSFTATMP
jgi:hypothetical protein